MESMPPNHAPFLSAPERNCRSDTEDCIEKDDSGKQAKQKPAEDAQPDRGKNPRIATIAATERAGKALIAATIPCSCIQGWKRLHLTGRRESLIAIKNMGGSRNFASFRRESCIEENHSTFRHIIEQPTTRTLNEPVSPVHSKLLIRSANMFPYLTVFPVVPPGNLR